MPLSRPAATTCLQTAGRSRTGNGVPLPDRRRLERANRSHSSPSGGQHVVADGRHPGLVGGPLALAALAEELLLTAGPPNTGDQVKMTWPPAARA